jgi:hypothetical protein
VRTSRTTRTTKPYWSSAAISGDPGLRPRDGPPQAPADRPGTARHVRLLRELRAMSVPGAYWPACR